MSSDRQEDLAAWAGAMGAALGPALEAAAATVAAEVSTRLPAQNQDAAVTLSQADDRVTVAVTLPGAVAREYGTRAGPAQPFLRPAVATARHEMGRRIVTALYRALQGGHFR